MLGNARSRVRWERIETLFQDLATEIEERAIALNATELGWNSHFEESFGPYGDDGYAAMRVIRENRGSYLAISELGKYSCGISGRYRHEARSKADYPAVGDWVAASPRSNERRATIHALLPRRNAFSRKVAGQVTDEQVVAANIDTVFVVTGLDHDYSLRRIERYLSVAWDSGITPVVLLNKSDICADLEERILEVESAAYGTDVIALSAERGDGMERLNIYIETGKTVAFLGSSGVGKSTIINSLLGAGRMKVNAVSSGRGKGRHTTTHRELVVLPGGGMVIDTPGMRELQVWGDDDGLAQVFGDIELLASNCRFRDCTHENEPGCAVRDALLRGTLPADRYESYLKLKREYDYLASRRTMKASAIEKARWKKISKLIRQLKNREENR